MKLDKKPDLTEQEQEAIKLSKQLAGVEDTDPVEISEAETEDIEVDLTSHTRGEAKKGYEHLLKSFELLYPEDRTPILLLQKAVEQLLPNLIKENTEEVKEGIEEKIKE